MSKEHGRVTISENHRMKKTSMVDRMGNEVEEEDTAEEEAEIEEEEAEKEEVMAGADMESVIMHKHRMLRYSNSRKQI